MKQKSITFTEAHTFVKQARSVINPNKSFIRQLQLYQRVLKNIDTINSVQSLWRLHKVALEQQAARYYSGSCAEVNLVTL